jgi:hypothetical protein
MKILTDCDGVWVNWVDTFHKHMQTLGHVKSDEVSYDMKVKYPAMSRSDMQHAVLEFNNSSAIAKLPALLDAVEGVAALRKAGYTFDMITSLSEKPAAKEYRQQNLDAVFGPDSVETLISIACGADKDEELVKYEGTGLWWIEDKPENCDTGLKFGLRPILIDHATNQWYNNENVIRVSNWKQLCGVILGE